MSRLVFHECLGRGGYGEVYRATWTRRQLENQVAVKVLNAQVSAGSDAAARLRDEAKLLGALTHPGILRVYDLVELEGSMAMIAEYVHGEDLDRCVLAGLPLSGLLEVVARVSSALAAAWGDISPVTGKPLRLVHRDIKPENIRLAPDGNPKLLDFGVARAAEVQQVSQTATNTVMGSYRYMSPERFDASCRPHPSIDVFALGCILYEGIAFKRLFGELSMRQMMMLSIPGSTRLEMHIDARLEELPEDTDSEVVELIRRLTNRNPDLRPLPGRLAAMCDDLAEMLPGPTLRQWARQREWASPSAAEGDWTGRQVDLSITGGDEDEASGYPLAGDEMTMQLAMEEHPTNDSGLRSSRDAIGEEPRLAPRGLRFGDEDPEPTEGYDSDVAPDPDQATVPVPRKVPPKVPKAPKRPPPAPRSLEEEPTEAGGWDAEAATQAMHALDMMSSTPTGTDTRAMPEEDGPTERDADATMEVEPEAPSRDAPPQGPEVHRAQHEKRAAAAQAARNTPAGADMQPVIANLVVLGILAVLLVVGGVLVLLLAL